VPWIRFVALLVLLLALAGGLSWFINRLLYVPVVVAVDTTAERGVYDEVNRGKGITNGEEIKTALRNLPVNVLSEPISI
jgi:type IV secretory pathway TrbF-like protein